MKNRRFFLFFLIACSIGLNIYFRLSTLFLRSLDKAVKNGAYATILDKVNREINITYPEFSEADKEPLRADLFKLYPKERKAQIKEAILQKSKELKGYYRDENGWPYMMEVDPYRWYRRVDNYLKNGHFGLMRINNQDYDNLMLAPLGAKIEPLRLHFYIGVYFHKFLHFFNNKFPLTVSLSFLPVFLSVFMVIGVFCVSIMLGLSYEGSLAASLAVGLSPFVLLRSAFGWFDTDIYNIFLPLFIISLAAYSFKVKGLKHIIFLFLSALLVGIFSAIWSIWWLSFYIVVAGLFLYKLCVIIYDTRKGLLAKVMGAVFSLFLFILFVYSSVLVISGPEALSKSFSEPFSLLAARLNLTADNFWPGMSFSISELTGAGISFIEKGVHGSFILYAGVFGILALIIKKRLLMDFSEKSALLFILFVWMSVMLVLTYLSRRFIIFLAVPIGIFFGVFLDITRDFMREQKNKIILLRKINEKAYAVFLSSIFVVGYVLPIYAASTNSLPPPIMNNMKEGMLVKIKNSTPQDAVIVAYRDDGDFIMTLAGRSTLHCAQYNMTPVEYWLARFFLSDNEKEALGILRMLNAGNTRAFEELSKLLGGDKLAAFELINKMILVSRDEGRLWLGQYSADNLLIDKILDLVYEPKHPAYLLIDSQLLSILYYHNIFANWDFRKQDLWRNFSKMDETEFINYASKKFAYSKDDAKNLYKSISLADREKPLDWISQDKYRFYSPYLEQKAAAKGQKTILFNNGLLVDKDNLNAFYWQDRLKEWIAPSEIIFVKQDGMTNKTEKFENKYSLLFFEEQDKYGAILADKHLAHSMLVKLYFMKGSGLKHFQLCEQAENKTKTAHMYLYKIEWGDI